MKASDYIVSFLEGKGIDTIFGYIGGMITHLVDSITLNQHVKFIQTYHEQTAAIAAEGYAIESGKFGVAISSSGPGVTNMMTGIADAYFDSIPVIYITGQVNTYEYKYDKTIRQQGFQEMDVVSVVKPIVKYAKMIDNAEDLCYELEKAIYIATSGRKGPVVLDLPMNISRAEIDPQKLRHFTPEDNNEEKNIDLDEIISLIQNSQRPMLLLGAGCHGVDEQISDFLNTYPMPVITSLMGRGAINETYRYYIGMLGSYGNRSANMTVAKSDLLIVAGSRLDTRQTGATINEFLPKGKIIHIDIDNNELENHRISNRIKINCSVQSFFSKIKQTSLTYTPNLEWLNWTLNIKEKYSQSNEIERFVENKTPYHLMQILNNLTQENDVITTDVGQNQMWAAQTICLKKGQKFLTSGGLAPMGYSLPAAIGVAFANPQKTIYCLNGDGGLQMAMQSLLLISQYKLNIKVIVLNNEALGMMTQFQHLYFNDRMSASTKQGGYILPDLKSLATSFKIPYYQITDLNEKTIKEICNKKYVFIDVIINGLTTVAPKLEYNKPIYQPMPSLSDNEIDDYMKQFSEN